MSEELVNTIVRKLDIAVSGAYQWMLKALNQYCTLSMLKSWAFVFVGMAFCALAIIFFNRGRKDAIARLNHLEHENWWSEETVRSAREESVWGWTFLTGAAVAVTAFVLVWLGGIAIGWTFFPDAMILKGISVL